MPFSSALRFYAAAFASVQLADPSHAWPSLSTIINTNRLNYRAVCAIYSLSEVLAGRVGFYNW